MILLASEKRMTSERERERERDRERQRERQRQRRGPWIFRASIMRSLP